MLKDISDLEAGDQKVLGISCDFTKGERVVVTGSPVRVIPSASMDKVVLLLLL